MPRKRRSKRRSLNDRCDFFLYFFEPDGGGLLVIDSMFAFMPRAPSCIPEVTFNTEPKKPSKGDEEKEIDGFSIPGVRQPG